MVDFRLLNGGVRATVIERFDGRALVLCGGRRFEFDSLWDCKKYLAEADFEVNVEMLHGPPPRSKDQSNKGGTS